jgi:hypothetical protein
MSPFDIELDATTQDMVENFGYVVAAMKERGIAFDPENDFQALWYLAHEVRNMWDNSGRSLITTLDELLDLKLVSARLAGYDDLMWWINEEVFGNK